MGRSQVLRRLASITVQQAARRNGQVPRIGNVLLRADYEGQISAGGPPRVTIDPFIGAMPARGPCASSLGQPAPEKIIVEYNSQSTDDFIALADSIEAAHSDLVVEGIETEMEPGHFMIRTEEGEVLQQGSSEIVTPDKVLESLANLGISQGDSGRPAQDCVI